MSGMTISTPSATETREGKVELATTAEVLTGTDTVRAITPAGFAGNKLVADNGYYRLPGGMTIQWGTANLPSANNGTQLAITFPIAFPNGYIKVTATPVGAGNGNIVAPLIAAITLSGFTLQQANPANAGTTKDYYWMAIGF